LLEAERLCGSGQQCSSGVPASTQGAVSSATRAAAPTNMPTREIALAIAIAAAANL
jgi:hypothetical protein